MWVVGFSGLYHDSAAAIAHDGEIVAAAQEERFTRLKHDARFPELALEYCLSYLPGGQALDAIAYYENPVLSLERVLKSAIEVAPRGGDIWPDAARSMFKKKLNVGARARGYVDADGKVLTVDHHISHAASTFYPSPFDEAAILVVDGVGEWATTTIARGRRNGAIEPLREIHFPHSLGLLYSAFTEYCGFKVNSGEYKLMGLAPYGRPRFYNKILDNLVDLKPDGSFRLNMDYFGFMESGYMTNELFWQLFKGEPVKHDGRLSFREMDIAASIQTVTNEIMRRLAVEALRTTGSHNLCLAGGVALNCVANGELLRRINRLKGMWVQPAAGDAGGAIGAALYAAHGIFGKPRTTRQAVPDGQGGSLLGPEFSTVDIAAALEAESIVFHHIADRASHNEKVVDALVAGQIVGRFDGRMEFGPRALGNRSILADPRSPHARSHINLRIKYRESWRPFAPVVLAEHATNLFDIDGESPYMLVVAPVREEYRVPVEWDAFRRGKGDMIEMLNKPRSRLPAITHVDYSARLQTVDANRNPQFHQLLSAFYERTDCPVLVNTSFNVRGEPIVCTPKDAIYCFLNTGLDLLAIGDFLAFKEEQPEELRCREGKTNFEPD